MISKGKQMLREALKSKKHKTTSGYPARDPKNAKPVKDPQGDMRTWKAPKGSKPSGVHTPFKAGRILAKKSKKKVQKGVMCKKHKVMHCGKC